MSVTKPTVDYTLPLVRKAIYLPSLRAIINVTKKKLAKKSISYGFSRYSIESYYAYLMTPNDSMDNIIGRTRRISHRIDRWCI